MTTLAQLLAPEGEAFIGGRWTAAVSGGTVASIDPATEDPIASVASCDATDVDAAVAAAWEAARDWGATPWTVRARALRELAGRLRDDAERLAQIDTLDGGNPIAGSRLDVEAAAGALEFAAGLGAQATGRTHPAGPAGLTFTERAPYGVVGRILAYNHPLMFAVQGTAMPLVTGNAVVLKPADPTALSALEVARLSEDLLPAGVLNVVPGAGAVAGAALAAHPRVPRLAFTGSVATGRRVLAAAAPQIKHVTLELGGKNPLVVLAGADPVTAARAAVAGMNLTRTNGQSCQSTSRVLAHESIRRDLQDALVAELEHLVVGPPAETGVDVGPLAFREHYDRVCGHVARAEDEGATLVTGGRRPTGLDRGFYLQPTLFADVDPAMAIAREEVFGPVLALLEWTDTDDMLAVANGTEYGLTANVVGGDLQEALRVARAVDAGMVWVNGPSPRPPGAPFGGVKASGIGREHGEEELLSYTQEKTVIVRL